MEDNLSGRIAINNLTDSNGQQEILVKCLEMDGR